AEVRVCCAEAGRGYAVGDRVAAVWLTLMHDLPLQAGRCPLDVAACAMPDAEIIMVVGVLAVRRQRKSEVHHVLACEPVVGEAIVATIGPEHALVRQGGRGVR